jgi:hypothetical protein
MPARRYRRESETGIAPAGLLFGWVMTGHSAQRAAAEERVKWRRSAPGFVFHSAFIILRWIPADFFGRK